MSIAIEFPGLEHIGCHRVVTSSTNIGLMEGRTDELKDSPFFREDPVNKCARAVIQAGYEFFGVAYGYCISGSSNSEDYTGGGTSSGCSDGAGGWGRSDGYSMDVYRIIDDSAIPLADVARHPSTFADSRSSTAGAEGHRGEDGEHELVSLELLDEDSHQGAGSAATGEHRLTGYLLSSLVLTTLIAY